jgi:hypothetical protein
MNRWSSSYEEWTTIPNSVGYPTDGTISVEKVEFITLRLWIFILSMNLYELVKVRFWTSVRSWITGCCMIEVQLKFEGATQSPISNHERDIRLFSITSHIVMKDIITVMILNR